MSQKHNQLKLLLDELEIQLRDTNQWSNQPLPPETLISDQPFALDKLNFNQWLQFLFVPRLQTLCIEQLDFPQTSSVAPMAEEFYAVYKVDGTKITSILAHIDHLITSA
ncbi:MAG: YqcC family protein [Porticoccaceae bacterium]|nr:YqcC family protein [Porticoccaceae bacterium]MDG1474088.1 YqcC family protein [Porticoccaceae bacterium]